MFGDPETIWQQTVKAVIMATKQHPDSQRAAILSIGTAVPQHCVNQEFVGRWMAESVGNDTPKARWIRRLYAGSGIETRYPCQSYGDVSPGESRFAPGCDPAQAATTAERMEIYEREAVIVGTEAARRAIDSCAADHGGDPAAVADSITHLIAVSCTGFFAPGLDQMIARQLELRPAVERIVVGFMGCAAAFNAMRLADQIVRGQPAARVLIVCVELCSLHVQPSQERVDLVGASLFCDGAGACIVGVPASGQRDIFELRGFYTELTPETESFMVWKIGNHGYTLHLSSAIPENLAQIAPQALQKLFDHAPPALRFWAIHPGGRGIVDKLSEIFALPPTEVEPSRTVLRDYGNMSSPTIFFVLQEHRKRLRHTAETAGLDSKPLDGVAMAFGPGLVTEMAHLAYVPGVSDAVRQTL
jgi:predicted naringenin-chalcone synthase